MGTARRFDGTNDQVRDLSNYYFNTDHDWSCGMWFWLDVATPAANKSILEAFDSDASFSPRWVYQATSGRIIARQSHATTNADAQIAAPGTGQWHCLVVNYVASTNVLTMYFGDLDTPMAEPSYVSQATGVGAVQLDMDYHGVGCNPNSSTSRPYDGAIAYPWMKDGSTTSLDAAERYRMGDLSALWSGSSGPSYLLVFGPNNAYDIIGQREWTVSGATEDDGPPRHFHFASAPTGILDQAASPPQDITPATLTITVSPVGQAMTPGAASLGAAIGTITITPVGQAMVGSGSASLTGHTGTITVAPQAQAMSADGVLVNGIVEITVQPVGQAMVGGGTASLTGVVGTVTITPVGQAIAPSGAAPIGQAVGTITVTPVGQAMVGSGTASLTGHTGTITVAPQAQAMSAAGILYQAIGEITVQPVGQAMVGSGVASLTGHSGTVTASPVGQAMVASGSGLISAATVTITVTPVGQAMVGSGAVVLSAGVVTLTLSAIGQALVAGSLPPGALARLLSELLSWLANQFETHADVTIGTTKRTHGPPVGPCCGSDGGELSAWWSSLTSLASVPGFCEPTASLRVLYRSCYPVGELLADGTWTEDADAIESATDDLSHVAESGLLLLNSNGFTSDFMACGSMRAISAVAVPQQGTCAGVEWSVELQLVPLLASA